MKQLIEDLISAMEYHVEQTRPIHSTTVALQAAKEALKAQPTPVQEPVGEWIGSRSKDSDPKRISWKPGYVMSAKVGDKIYTTPPEAVPIKPTVPADANINQRMAFVAGWKAAEAAHGITANKTDQA